MPRQKPATAGPQQKAPLSKPARRRAATKARAPQQHSVPARDVRPLTPESCLLALCQLADRVERRMVKPAEANALRAIYQTMLDYHQKSDTPQRQILSDDVVRELLKAGPRILSELEPLLTEEQFAIVMQEVRDAPG